MYFEIDDYNALRKALHKMCDKLSAEGVPQETVFDSKLVANELLTNVLQHEGGKAYFRAEFVERKITISVKSDGAYRPPARCDCSAVDAERGRGLYIVDALGTRAYDEEKGISVEITIEK